MMFYDRLTGVQIKDLPERILPGRYCNKKTLTQNFDNLILDDGSGSIKFEGVEKKFLQIEFLYLCTFYQGITDLIFLMTYLQYNLFYWQSLYSYMNHHHPEPQVYS